MSHDAASLHIYTQMMLVHCCTCLVCLLKSSTRLHWGLRWLTQTTHIDGQVGTWCEVRAKECIPRSPKPINLHFSAPVSCRWNCDFSLFSIAWRVFATRSTETVQHDSPMYICTAQSADMHVKAFQGFKCAWLWFHRHHLFSRTSTEGVFRPARWIHGRRILVPTPTWRIPRRRCSASVDIQLDDATWYFSSMFSPGGGQLDLS